MTECWCASVGYAGAYDDGGASGGEEGGGGGTNGELNACVASSAGPSKLAGAEPYGSASECPELPAFPSPTGTADTSGVGSGAGGMTAT